ncbi:MAG: hypothetical protein M1140_15655, partial [Chloroflexi bacterium]|nr:hypothetical protein [Chloroflexota bacterium]
TGGGRSYRIARTSYRRWQACVPARQKGDHTGSPVRHIGAQGQACVPARWEGDHTGSPVRHIGA